MSEQGSLDPRGHVVYAPHTVSGKAQGPQAVLSREFSEFLVALSIALHKHAMYPAGHPSLGPAATDLTRRVLRLLEDRAMVALGVARHQLIIDGVATDDSQPVLRRLADGLHRHHLGAVSFTRGLAVDETAEALRALSADAEREGPLGLRPAATLPSWPHLRLHPLTFERLALAEGARPSGEQDGAAASRSVELWIGLASAALSGDGESALVDAATEPAVVARALDEHPRAEAYDQVIVGYLLQIARELRTAGGEDAGVLRRRTSRLIAALRPDTLRRFLEMGGNVVQRRDFLLNAADGLAVDAVIEIVKAAAEASGQTISHGLVRMLSKLAAHAELGDEHRRPVADANLREQVGRLIADWSLADPNPELYGRLLQHVATTGVGRGRTGRTDDHDALPLRILQMGLEIDAEGPMLERAVSRSIEAGLAREAVALLAEVPGQAERAARAVAERLRQPAALATLLAVEPVDFDTLDRLLPFAPPAAYERLLDALAESESRVTRRRLLDRLSSSPVDLLPHIVKRLSDERWYVQRNMLALLERAGRVPEGVSIEPWTRHHDRRVRYQAIRVALLLPAGRDRALRNALEDDDPKLNQLALTSLQAACPPALVDDVAAIALDMTAPEEHRVLAIRALAHVDAPRSLDTLLTLADGGRTILGRARLAPRSAVLLAALQGLAGRWSSDERAAAVLGLAAGASDPAIRAAAKGGTS